MQVKVESIEKAVKKIDNLDEDGLEKISEENVLNQTQLVGYIMSSSIEFDNEQLMELLIYYFNIFMEAIKNEGAELKVLSEDNVDEFHEEYTEVLDEFSKKEDIENVLDFCNQPILFSFLMNELNLEDETGQTLDDETSNALFLTGVALISLLDRAIKR